MLWTQSQQQSDAPIAIPKRPPISVLLLAPGIQRFAPSLNSPLIEHSAHLWWGFPSYPNQWWQSGATSQQSQAASPAGHEKPQRQWHRWWPEVLQSQWRKDRPWVKSPGHDGSRYGNHHPPMGSQHTWSPPQWWCPVSTNVQNAGSSAADLFSSFELLPPELLSETLQIEKKLSSKWPPNSHSAPQLRSKSGHPAVFEWDVILPTTRLQSKRPSPWTPSHLPDIPRQVVRRSHLLAAWQERPRTGHEWLMTGSPLAWNQAAGGKYKKWCTVDSKHLTSKVQRILFSSFEYVGWVGEWIMSRAPEKQQHQTKNWRCKIGSSCSSETGNALPSTIWTVWTAWSCITALKALETRFRAIDSTTSKRRGQPKYTLNIPI